MFIVFQSSNEYDDDDEYTQFASDMKKEYRQNRTTKKTGRKSQWDNETTNDLVNIILENEKLKEKLLLTNVKNTKNSQYYELVITQLTNRCQERNKEFDFNVNQTREKFKRCVSLCREAALKINKGSGIKRFQEEKQYESWFSSLFAIVQSMDSI